MGNVNLLTDIPISRRSASVLNNYSRYSDDVDLNLWIGLFPESQCLISHDNSVEVFSTNLEYMRAGKNDRVVLLELKGEV